MNAVRLHNLFSNYTAGHESRRYMESLGTWLKTACRLKYIFKPKMRTIMVYISRLNQLHWPGNARICKNVQYESDPYLTILCTTTFSRTIFAAAASVEIQCFFIAPPVVGFQRAPMLIKPQNTRALVPNMKTDYRAQSVDHFPWGRKGRDQDRTFISEVQCHTSAHRNCDICQLWKCYENPQKPPPKVPANIAK